VEYSRYWKYEYKLARVLVYLVLVLYLVLLVVVVIWCGVVWQGVSYVLVLFCDWHYATTKGVLYEVIIQTP